MGASASSLPDHLTENDFKHLCGDSYNHIYYIALKETGAAATGSIQKDMLLSISTDGIEKEIFQLFLNFCPNGEMESKTFIKFLKDTKSLNKNSFTSGDADLIFQKYKTKYGSKSLNYYVFRTAMIPDIAVKKSLEVEKYLQKLAHCEGPVLHATQAEANRFHDDKSTYTGAHAQGGPSFENSSGSTVSVSHCLTFP
jgi:phosphorylcholine metabolism protein LicD